MKKRILACILALVLAISLVPAAFAATDEATEAAQALYEMGLFRGVGKDANGNPNFDLDRTPSRNEAVTMLVRLLGKEQEAKDGTWETPFTDVTGWAKPYVGYAYERGLTTGASSTTYGGDADVTVSQYLTFVLRALGYTSGTDFKWNAAWELSDKIGLTDGRYNASTTHFTRGDVAIISKAALSTMVKGSNLSLADKLQAGEAKGLQGIWKGVGKDYDEEYVFGENTYTCARLWTYNDNGAVGFSDGTYKLTGDTFEFDCTYTYTSYAYKTNEFNGKRQNTFQRTEKLKIIDGNSFQNGGLTYYRVSESTLTAQVKDELGRYLLEEEATTIRNNIEMSANCMAVALTYMMTANRYNITASNPLLGSASERRLAAIQEEKYVKWALSDFTSTKKYVTAMRNVVANGEGTMYSEILSRCDKILVCCDNLLALTGADTESVKAANNNATQMLNLLTEISNLINT